MNIFTRLLDIILRIILCNEANYPKIR